VVYNMISVKDWKLCGLQNHGSLYWSYLVFQNSPAAHRLQEMRIAGRYGKSKASKERRYIAIGDLGVRGTRNSQLRFLKGKNDRVAEPARDTGKPQYPQSRCGTRQYCSLY
jgi:hypothetical protein